MGNNGSLPRPQSDESQCMAISPYCLVSMINKPYRADFNPEPDKCYLSNGFYHPSQICQHRDLTQHLQDTLRINHHNASAHFGDTHRTSHHSSARVSDALRKNQPLSAHVEDTIRKSQYSSVSVDETLKKSHHSLAQRDHHHLDSKDSNSYRAYPQVCATKFRKSQETHTGPHHLICRQCFETLDLLNEHLFLEKLPGETPTDKNMSQKNCSLRKTQQNVDLSSAIKNVHTKIFGSNIMTMAADSTVEEITDGHIRVSVEEVCGLKHRLSSEFTLGEMTEADQSYSSISKDKLVKKQGGDLTQQLLTLTQKDCQSNNYELVSRPSLAQPDKPDKPTRRMLISSYRSSSSSGMSRHTDFDQDNLKTGKNHNATKTNQCIIQTKSVDKSVIKQCARFVDNIRPETKVSQINDRISETVERVTRKDENDIESTIQCHSLGFSPIKGDDSYKLSNLSSVNHNLQSRGGCDDLDSICCETRSFSRASSAESVLLSSSTFYPDPECAVNIPKGSVFESWEKENNLQTPQDSKFLTSEDSYAQIIDKEPSCLQNEDTYQIYIDFDSADKMQTHSEAEQSSEFGQPSKIQSHCSVCSCGAWNSSGSDVTHRVKSYSMCESCHHLSENPAANTIPFDVNFSADFSSTLPQDSWSVPGMEATDTKATNRFSVFDDGSDDWNAHGELENSGEASNTSLKQPAQVADAQFQPCEVATEQFGIHDPTENYNTMLSVGAQCMSFCKHIVNSQRRAENDLRGADSLEFCFRGSQCKSGSNTTTCQHPGKTVPAGQRMAIGSSTQSRHTGQRDYTCFHNCGCISRLEPSPNSGKHPATARMTTEHSDTSGVPESHLQDLSSSFQPASDTDLEQSFHTIDHTNRRPQQVVPGGMNFPHNRSLSFDCSNPYRQNYVAYLCCAPDDLSSFGLTFHRMIESWGFRIFIAPRDLELTGPKYDNMSRWLEERCNGKIIVVLSKNYGTSDECMFLTHFARSLDPDSKFRNIIPVMIDKDVEIPNVLKGLSIIKYNYDFRCGWLKKKLVNAIAA